jgi:hypothetical protein
MKTKSLIDQALKSKKIHRTGHRVTVDVWETLMALSETTGLSVNEIINTAVLDLIAKESYRLKEAA